MFFLHHPIYNGLFATVGPDSRDRLKALVTRDDALAVLAGHTHITSAYDADGNSRDLSLDAQNVDPRRLPLHYTAARSTNGRGGYAVFHLARAPRRLPLGLAAVIVLAPIAVTLGLSDGIGHAHLAGWYDDELAIAARIAFAGSPARRDRYGDHRRHRARRAGLHAGVRVRPTCAPWFYLRGDVALVGASHLGSNYDLTTGRRGVVPALRLVRRRGRGRFVAARRRARDPVAARRGGSGDRLATVLAPYIMMRSRARLPRARLTSAQRCVYTFVLSRPAADAGVAQLVEHLICNQAVAGSSPTASSKGT